MPALDSALQWVRRVGNRFLLLLWSLGRRLWAWLRTRRVWRNLEGGYVSSAGSKRHTAPSSGSASGEQATAGQTAESASTLESIPDVADAPAPRPAAEAAPRRSLPPWLKRFLPGEEDASGEHSFLSLFRQYQTAIYTLCALIVVVLAWSLEPGEGLLHTASATELTPVTVTLVDAGHSMTLTTYETTVDQLLVWQGISLGVHDVLSPSRNHVLTEGLTVTIERMVWVTVTADGASQGLAVPEGTRVGAVIEQLGITLDNVDQLSPQADDEVSPNMAIAVHRIEASTIFETQAIPFEIVEVDNQELMVGETSIVRNGVEGKERLTVGLLYRDGNLISREILLTEVVRQPISQVVEVGSMTPTPKPTPKATPKATAAPTKKPSATATPKPASSTKSGAPKEGEYTKILSMQVTAYTHTGHKTSTGVWPKRGTIAVDPSVIPYGTKLYVEGYGYGVAQDTGPTNNHIDLFMETRAECVNYGRRFNVKVYILK